MSSTRNLSPLRTVLAALVAVALAMGVSACGRDTADAASLHTARQMAAVASTAAGALVVVGGATDMNDPLDAPFEVYADGEWADGPWPGGALTEHAVAPLGQHEVLVVGGRAGDGVTDRAWRIDSSTRTAGAASPIPGARVEHVATSLADGRVLVTGGRDVDGRPLASAVVYDPATDAWTQVAPMPHARASHGVSQLEDGRVLVFGGAGQDTLYPDVDAWDPVADTWTAERPMPRERVEFAWAVLPGGDVLVVGGRAAPGWLQSAVRFDVARHEWLDAGRAGDQGAGSTLVVTADGTALWVGGYKPVSAQYDIGNDAIWRWDGAVTWTQVGRVHETRARAAAGMLPDGTAIIIGGATTRGRALSTCELLDGARLGGDRAH